MVRSGASEANKLPDVFVSNRGGLALALRRNACNTPAAAMGIGLSIDCHGTSVIRWEHLLDGCFRAANAAFHDDIKGHLSQHGGFGVHLIRSDATNAKVRHQSKLHVLEFSSRYVIPNSDDDMDATSLGDFLVVPDSSGATCRSLILQQLKSCGPPTWKREVDREKAQWGDDMKALPVTDRLKPQFSQRSGPKTSSVFIQVTDHGPDQVKARKNAARECLDVLWT